jgi:glucose/mannose-6-phosphate isomerase
MKSLDDLSYIKKIDPQGMYDLLLSFPVQVDTAYAIGQRCPLPEVKSSSVKNIVVTGMGGSAIGGDLARSYLAEDLKIPFLICRNYTLPTFVGPDSLVIASSYSGNTEETVEAYQQAKDAGAKLLAITTGGELAEKATSDRIPLIKIPPGLPPRAALGYSFVPLLVSLWRMKLAPDRCIDFFEGEHILKQGVDEYRVEVPLSENLAKEMATKLHRKLPIIYSATDHFDAVAVRFKGQLCENSKMLAFFNFFPEFNHNELVGWNKLYDLQPHLAVVILRDEDDHHRIRRRMELVRGIVEDLDVPVYELESKGGCLLERMFSLIQLGDFISFYLAILNEVDPTPVEVIDYLKRELAKS